MVVAKKSNAQTIQRIPNPLWVLTGPGAGERALVWELDMYAVWGNQ